MMENRSAKAWLYLLPALVFVGIFMVYPLVDVFVYSFEEGYNSASQTFFGVGTYNYSYILRDPYFLQALKNTLILVIITVPVSTGLCRRAIRYMASMYPTIREISTGRCWSRPVKDNSRSSSSL